MNMGGYWALKTFSIIGIKLDTTTLVSNFTVFFHSVLLFYNKIWVINLPTVKWENNELQLESWLPT